MNDIKRFLKDIRTLLTEIQNPAAEGDRHPQIIIISQLMRRFGFHPNAIFVQLREMYSQTVTDNEITEVVEWAEAKVEVLLMLGAVRSGDCRSEACNGADAEGGTLNTIKENIHTVTKGFACTRQMLRQASVVPMAATLSSGTAALLLRHIYRQSDAINIVQTSVLDGSKYKPKGYGETLLRNEWLARLEANKVPSGIGGVWIRMNPLNGKGISDSDVVAHRFVLLEMDGVDEAAQLAFFAKVSLPIAAIIHSGGKSVHAWVQINAADESQYKASVKLLFDTLAPYGIDQSNSNSSRLSRLPGVLRILPNGVCQELLYLNPNPSGKAIYE